jgi:hypothetical protein
MGATCHVTYNHGFPVASTRMPHDGKLTQKRQSCAESLQSHGRHMVRALNQKRKPCSVSLETTWVPDDGKPTQKRWPRGMSHVATPQIN